MSQTQQLPLTHFTCLYKQNSRLHEQRHHLLLPQQSISHVSSTPTLPTGPPPPATDRPPPPPRSSVPRPKASSPFVVSIHSEVVWQATPSPLACDGPNSGNPSIGQCHTLHSPPTPPSTSPLVDTTGEVGWRIHSRSTRSSDEKKGRNARHPDELSEHSLLLISSSIAYSRDPQTGNGAMAESTDLWRSPELDLLLSFSSLSSSTPTQLGGCRMKREVFANTIPHTLIREDPVCV